MTRFLYLLCMLLPVAPAEGMSLSPPTTRDISWEFLGHVACRAIFWVVEPQVSCLWSGDPTEQVVPSNHFLGGYFGY
ncbi:hypothetical protein QBC47DRAFT_70087 [Echria macrotheca]|uniref:Uncharacterized protein n=1 Tax=Echria macrotheca TaxID=438768 RepID=A0AAJ0F6H0_9PEZI|nr:hypothetical protein QBC47DRAFT_70087 [Echria macrotheca]